MFEIRSVMIRKYAEEQRKEALPKMRLIRFGGEKHEKPGILSTVG